MAVKHKDDSVVNIPQLKGVPVLGNLLDIDLENPSQSVAEIAKRPEFKDVMSLSFGGIRMVFVNSVALVDEVCDESRFSKNIYSGLEKLRLLVGDGLFTARNDEPNWAIAHRILMPVFGPMKIREMLPQMKDVASQMCLKWARHGEAYDIDVASDCTRLTLDTIALCAMDFRFNSFYDNTTMHPFVNSMLVSLHEADLQANIPEFIDSLRARSHKKYEKHVKYMHDVAQGIIERRRARPVEAPDLLNCMLNGRDPQTGQGMTDESIIYNMVTFLVAGHETTSGMLSFALYNMLKRPSTLEKARQEVDEVAGTMPLTNDHLVKLPYINAVLRETLRLHPTAPAFGVSANKDEVIGEKYRVKAGDVVFANLLVSQLDKSVYGTDAETFKPERMLDENFNKLPKGAWKPFGNGMRGCIGRPFAWQEALLDLAMILQNFDLEMADPNYKLKIKETLTIKPEGFKMRAKLRRCTNATGLAVALQSGTDAVTAPKKMPTTSLATPAANAKPISLFYGSNTGTCELLARHLARDATAKGFSADPIAPLNSATKRLPIDRPLVILTASYDGQPADNAGQFVKWLESLNAEVQPLKGITYAVFGCGHRDWPATLFRIPALIDALLEKGGAKRLVKMGTADSAVSDLVSDLDDWSQLALWPALGHSADVAGEVSLIQSLLQVSVSHPRRLETHENLIQATVTSSSTITQPDARVKKRHLELELPEGTQYEPGDHLVVLPTNPKATVKRVLALFRLSWDSVVSTAGDHKLPRQESITASELLSSYTELAQPATPKDIRVLMAATTDEETHKVLHRLSSESFESDIREPRTSLLDILERFPSISLSFGTFLALLPSIRMRTYSISSSRQFVGGGGPTPLSLTFSVLDEPSRSGPQTRFFGVASNYLADLTSGDVLYVGVRKTRDAFHLPEDTANPVVMVAAGTGYAPFRGFVQELQARRKLGSAKSSEAAPATLFFGCRGPEDDIYREELDEAESAGIVRVIRAYSRSSATGIFTGHVQDALRQHQDELVRLWKSGAKFFVCGNARMAGDVKAVVRDAARSATGAQTSDDTCATWFSQFEPERYAAEIFA